MLKSQSVGERTIVQVSLNLKETTEPDFFVGFLWVRSANFVYFATKSRTSSDINEQYFHHVIWEISEAWIAFSCKQSETNGETQFMWSDGSALYYTNWETNQPQDTNSGIGCVEMREYGTWSVVSSGVVSGSDSCSSKRPFVCKYEECK